MAHSSMSYDSTSYDESYDDMSYHDTVRALADDAEQLEQVYHTAQKAGQKDKFEQAIAARHTADPENLLYAAWFYRLQYVAAQAKGFVVAWAWVIPLALLNGLVFWWLSDESRYMIRIVGPAQVRETGFMPAVFLLAAPLAALFVLAYLTAAGHQRWRVAMALGILPVAAGAYVLWAYPQAGTRPFQEQYLTLMLLHLPLLSWGVVGAFTVHAQHDPASRPAFLLKSLEVFVTGGLAVMAGGLFTAITVSLFAALDIDLPNAVMRLFIAGGGGLIPVVATGIIYNPAVAPAEQDFEEGLSKLLNQLVRFLLPLTLLVLLVYLAFIPFNFREPFNNRDVLITYNGMLFAVIALLVGVTPVRLTATSPRLAGWLRIGIIAVATLALIVSLYALAAILYRTAMDRLTPNRLTFIGWNITNGALLCLLLYFQARAGRGVWLPAVHRAYNAGTVAYVVWTTAMVLALPWLFGINQGEMAALSPSVQAIVFEVPPPILLKCAESPHIYLLDRGEKRWINTIETLNAQGYRWRDVHHVPCSALRSIPDGASIPAEAGPPPQP